MKRISLFMLATLITLSGCSTSCVPVSPDETSVTGPWSGELRSSDGEYVERFSVDLVQSGSALWGSGVDPDGERVTAKGNVVDDQVRINLWDDDGSAELSGVLSGNRITGTWSIEDVSGPFWINKTEPQNKTPEHISKGRGRPLEARTFEQAVLQSIQADHEHQPVVIVVNRTGAITVAGRPTTLDEIEGISKVAGLPESPPAVFVRVHQETRHDDVRKVLDALTNAGVWQIIVPRQR